MKVIRKLMTMKSKLIAMLISISLIPILVLGISTYLISYNVLDKKLETTSMQTTKEVTRGINNYFSAMSNILKILSNDTNLIEADNSIYLEFGKVLMENAKNTDPNIINIYVGTEQGKFYVEPYVELPGDFDHRTRDWYQQAKHKSDEIFMTNPYVDTASGKLVVSFSMATLKNGNVVGVVGMDVELNALARSLSGIKIGNSGYIYITDENGILISHPDESLIGTDTVLNFSFWKEAKENINGFVNYEYQGERKFASFDTSEFTGWKVMASLNYSELSQHTLPILVSILIISIVTFICAILLSIMFSAPIGKNIKILLNSFQRMAQGDLTTRVTIKSKDEFYLLGTQFNNMSQNVSKLIQNVSDVSTTVLDSSVVLSSMAEETSASINEVSRAIEEVAKGATEQAQYASTSADNISELADNLNQIDDSTEVIDSLSQNARELTLQGLNRVDTLIQSSEITMKSTVNVSELVSETCDSIKKIDAISNTIDMITAQTNLLSLNASIEAARAGESGKGFAVVANEIRNLAEQSKESTVKIKAIIEDINRKTELSVEAMEITKKNVKEQEQLVNETHSLFTDIMNAIHTLSVKVTEIKKTTDGIASNKDQMVSQIENMSAVSEETASSTEEVTSSSVEIAITMDEITKHAADLHRLSEQLQERINSFDF